MLLKASNIHKTYNQAPHRLSVLKGINLEVEEGTVLAIVGPSGAGKSTLLHILGGLDKPDEGEILLSAKNIYFLSEDERASLRNSAIGFVFQFYHLLPEFTALENVLLPALMAKRLLSREKSSQELKAMSLLEKVGLKDRVFHRPNQLSGGEQQRVAIARALMNDPKMILCDEPTGNLDSESGQKIIELLMDLNRKNRQTLIVVTHDQSLAQMATKVVQMRDGRLV